jgi:hypothetical protein
LNKTCSIRLSLWRTHPLHPIGTMGGGVSLFPQFGSPSSSPQELKNDEHTNGPFRSFALSPTTIILLWFKLQISLISTLCSPVLLSSLVTRKPSRRFSGRAPQPPWRRLGRERRIGVTKQVRFYRVSHSSVPRFLPVIPRR